MARIRVSGASGSSENTIIFIPSGGHSHDGVTSSLISTEKYSIYDFSPSFVNSTQSQTRAIRQENNRLAFESLVINIVNRSVLAPAGIRLGPDTLNASAIIANTITAVHLAANTITADEIAANTITADELVSNIVLVNNIIRSNVYTSGSVGWRISNDGTAEFSNVVVRGNIFSNVGTIGGWTLASDAIYVGTKTASGSYTASTGHMTIGSDGHISANKFRINSDGTLFATNADISGTITTTSATIGGWSVDSSGIFKAFGGGTARLSSIDATLNIYDAGTKNTSVQPGYIFVGDTPSGSTIINNSRIDTGNVWATNLSATSGVAGATVYATNTISTGSTGTVSAEYHIGSGTVTVASGLSTALRRRDADGYFLILASKRELKKDIATIENSLDVIQKLNPVSFRWKDESSFDYYNDEIKDILKSRKEYGFIAEEVEDSVPDLAVYQSSDNGSKITPSMWQENGVISLCVASIKELLSKINILEGRIQELENKV
jgi:hypothetical protein